MESKLIEEAKNFGFEIAQENYLNEEDLKNNKHYFRFWRLPKENYKLKSTPFYFDSENDFIHFTSIESLYSILNSGFIRLYNLVHMDDKFELDFAKNKLSFNKKISINKEDFYCLSMCSSKKILNNDTKKHLLWKLYGKNGFGAIIRLKIKNNLEKWLTFHLSEMYYNLNNFKPVKRLNTITKTEAFDSKLACFIKLPIYKFEHEIRIIFDNQNPATFYEKKDILKYPITYPDKLHKSGNIQYFQLPLLNFQNEKKVKGIYSVPNVQGKEYEMPKLFITEVILGFRYSNTDLKNIKSKFKTISNSIIFKLSSLKKYY